MTYNVHQYLLLVQGLFPDSPVPFTARRILPICVQAVTPAYMQQVWWLLITSVCGFVRPASVPLQPFFARRMLPHFVPPAMLTSILPTPWHIVTTVSQLFPFQVATFFLHTDHIYSNNLWMLSGGI
uniref:Putative ovule protein n=1 Tax=Solanum chacoense TaxID=4108 RepID=A0A0V0GNP0_SOLCH